MLTYIKNWIYHLLVRSHIVYHLLPVLGPWFLRYVTNWYKGDRVTDDSGHTMKVTRWNGKNVTAFTHSRYSTVKDIEIRKDDVFVCGYPKTGCHWVFEIVYMLAHRRPELSRHGKLFEGMIDAIPDLFLDSTPSPRVLNSHLLYHELPTGIQKYRNKIILTIRCPKDTVVSFYHHSVKLQELYGHYEGSFEDYFKMFMRGEVDHADYFDTYLSWSQVMKNQRDSQIFLLEFEKLKSHPVETIMKMAAFLEISITRDFAEEVAEASRFSKLQEKRQSVIFRKGVVGDWKNLLTEKQADQIDEMWREKMAGPEVFQGTLRYCQDGQ